MAAVLEPPVHGDRYKSQDQSRKSGHWVRGRDKNRHSTPPKTTDYARRREAPGPKRPLRVGLLPTQPEYTDDQPDIHGHKEYGDKVQQQLELADYDQDARSCPRENRSACWRTSVINRRCTLATQPVRGQ